jgi:hypothetical protein
MLLYEYGVRDRIIALVDFAKNVRIRFESGVQADLLLSDARSLKVLADQLIESLPQEIKNVSNLSRHVSWMIHWLEKDSIRSCEDDVVAICDFDIPEIEKAFLAWTKRQEHYDQELSNAVANLVLRQERDSAIRKAFVILKKRLVKLFNAPESLDGKALVNHIFGGKGTHNLKITDSDVQDIRDLLAGLYGVYRNRFAHHEQTATWAECDGILSMINLVLIDLDKLKKTKSA